jgi:hypothetical protein
MSSSVSVFPSAVNLMTPPGVVPPDNIGEVHTQEVIDAYLFNGFACADDDIDGMGSWGITLRSTSPTGPFTTVRNRVSNCTYHAIKVDMQAAGNANAQWYTCPYRHNLIFIDGTHCAYTGSVLPFCPCDLCAGFRPWPFQSSSIWNGIRYVLVTSRQLTGDIPSTTRSRRPRERHADDSDDESDSVQQARVARRQRRRSILVSTPPKQQQTQGNVIHFACVGMDGTVGSDDDEELPDLITTVAARVPEDIDLSTEPVSEPVVVEDDLDHPGTLLYPTPLPGPHVVVVNAVTGQPYRAQRMSIRHHGQITSVWYRDVYRHNITYISGTLCQQTMTSIETCTCEVCRCIRCILTERRTCMRPLSPSRNRETYVYVREHVPPSTHTPSDSSSITYIDDSAYAETLHSQRVSNPLDPLRISSFLQKYARNTDGTFVSTPVSIASAFINVPLPAHMRRPLSFMRAQNVTPVRSTRP